MLRNSDGEEICPVDIHAPELADAVNGVVDGFEVLGEACGGDEIIDLAVLLENLGDGGFDGFLGGDVGVMGRYFGTS